MQQPTRVYGVVVYHLRNGDLLRSLASIVQSSAVVRDLGVLLDSELPMKHHISKVTSTCYYHLMLQEVTSNP